MTLLLSVSGVFAWATAIPAALVALRDGPARSVMPLLAALAVAVFHWQGSEPTLLGAVLVTWGGALVLGARRSLPQALLAAVAIAAVFTALLQTVASSQLAALFEQYQQVMNSLNSSGAGQIEGFSPPFFLQLMGIWVAMSGMVSIFIARSMQARLYNPGGFRLEFHGMRFTPAQSALCVAPLLLVQVTPEAAPVAGLFILPVMMGGLALVHGVAARKGMGIGPLVVVYLGLLLMAPVVTPMLLIAALADSFFDFRNRMTQT